MKKLVAAFALICAVLVVTTAGSADTGRPGTAPRAAATPGIAYGVADDASKYADDGGDWFYGQLQGAGLTEDRWTLLWDPANPSTISELAFLQRAAPRAQAAGVHVVLALYAVKSAAHDADQFCAWAATVVQTVQPWGITDFIVWNEPNTQRFWVPQKDGAGRDVAAPAYAELLAKCYDAIKTANPNARVIGMGLSPRASTGGSNEPLVFLRDVGKAYRQSGRTKPLMDQLDIHPYPNPNSPTDSPDVGYQTPDRFGISNLDRIKQAVYDAFNGTAQPTTLNGLTFRIDEIGWQVTTTGLPQYFGDENVKTVSEDVQSRYLKRMIEKYFACDPAVTDVLLFLLEDEKYRAGKDEQGKVVGGGWQSGLITFGGPGVSQPRQAYATMAAEAAAGRAACKGPLSNWKPVRKGAFSRVGDQPTSMTLGDPDGLLDEQSAADFQAALTNLAAQLKKLPPLSDATNAQLSALYTGALKQLLAATGPMVQDTIVTAGVSSCPAVTGNCSINGVMTTAWANSARVLSAAAPKPRLLASGSATVLKASPIKLQLRNTLRAKAGSYFVIVTLQGKTDATKRYAFGLQLRSVVHTAKPKVKHKRHR